MGSWGAAAGQSWRSPGPDEQGGGGVQLIFISDPTPLSIFFFFWQKRASGFHLLLCGDRRGKHRFTPVTPSGPVQHPKC